MRVRIMCECWMLTLTAWKAHTNACPYARAHTCTYVFRVQERPLGLQRLLHLLHLHVLKSMGDHAAPTHAITTASALRLVQPPPAHHCMPAACGCCAAITSLPPRPKFVA